MSTQTTKAHLKLLITFVMTLLHGLVLSAATVIAQSSGGPYKMTSSVIASGASSSGGSISVAGTLGQPVAGGPIGQGSKSHYSGFWHTVAGQTQPQQGGSTTIQFSAPAIILQEKLGAITVNVTRNGDTTGTSSVSYETQNGTASERSDYEYAAGQLTFIPGETIKTVQLLLNEDMYSEGTEQFSLVLSEPLGAAVGQVGTMTIILNDDAPEQATNPIEEAQSFVHQQYHDFLNREPDPQGLAFWTNEITSCGADPNCIDAKRVHVSAAFFLSIEFQETGYLVYRGISAAYGVMTEAPESVKLHDFLMYTQMIGKGVVVNQPGWQQTLESNKQAFFLAFVKSDLFGQEFANSMSPVQLVDNWLHNAQVTVTAAERQAMIDQFGGAGTTGDVNARAKALRMIAEHPTLINSQLNRAFVLMQYFGYLRRNPFDSPEPGLNYDGYKFWLNKLNQFNGDFVDAEMVRSFLLSGEYRLRFGF